MVDKGKVLRNVYKKKLAEYVQAKEQKGEQDVHSETVPTTKSPVEKPQQREKYELNFEFKKRDGTKEDVIIEANLSVAERKKLVNFAKYINNSISLSSSALVVERLSNLLKRVITESSGYSADFADAMIDLLNTLNNNLESVVKVSKAKQGLQGIRNVINQLIEVFNERKENLYPEEEGITSLQEKKNKKVKIPFTEGTYEEEEEEEESSRSPSVSSLGRPSSRTGSVGTSSAEEEYEEFLRQQEEEEPSSAPAEASSSAQAVVPEEPETLNIPDFPTREFGGYKAGDRITAQNEIEEMYEEFKKKFTSQEQITQVYRFINETVLPKIRSATVSNASGKKVLIDEVLPNLKSRLRNVFNAYKKKGKGMGMRKTKQNTYRGYTGYGDKMPMKGCGHTPEHVVFSTTPAIDKGFATAPMNANSPFNQPAYRSKQTNAIPKYLNFNVIPNERGNFAVIED